MTQTTATNARPSTVCPDRDGAMDVDVTVVIDGRVSEGEVTLLPAQYDGRLSAWGDPDNWVSGGLLAALRSLDDDDFSSALTEIERAAREVAS